MVIISDTSPISNLIQIGKLEILNKLFGENQNIINKVKPLVEELESQAGFYIRNKLKKVIYNLVNENS